MDPTTRHRVEDWQTLCIKITQFQKAMIDLAANCSLRRGICRHISNGVEAVRSDDCARLKDWILTFLSFTKEVITPPISPTGNKSNRGWNHELTASLLCPINLPATQETYWEIVDGNIIVTADQFPHFLYPHNHQYQPGDDLTAELLQGYLMIRTAKFIFISPGSALSAPGKSGSSRHGNAALAGITSVNARMVAYVAVQLHFALSSTPDWGQKNHSVFNYCRFYWNIVSVIEDDDKEGQAILEHYNYHLWGNKAGFTSNAGPETNAADANQVPAAPSDLDILRAQCASKRARREA
ncbi:hypothetical protein EYR36_004936 [Pleurotus pulmonarius]|nr:hypothetical protein EYR36_004936 [Pleurotus pulmonarius]